MQVGFGKRDIIDLTSLEHLESDILGLDHLVGHGIKQRAVRIPVKGVLRKHLFVCIDVSGNGIAAVVPHIVIRAGKEAVHTKLLNQVMRGGIETVIGSQRGEVGHGAGAVINEGIIVRCLDTNHLLENRQVKIFALFLGQAGGGQIILGTQGFKRSLVLFVCFLGIIIGIGSEIFITGRVIVVVLRTGDHLLRHGGVIGAVLVEVQNPLKAPQPVVCNNVRLRLRLVINPLHTLAQMECPC